MPLGAYTRTAKAAKAMELEEHWVWRARYYAQGHKLGGRATVSTMLFSWRFIHDGGEREG